MSVSTEYIGNKRFHEELVYGFYGVNGKISESVAPGVVWALKEFRVHFSTAFISVEYLVLKVSSILGAQYKTTIYSQLVSGSTDIFVHYSTPLVLLSDDHLTVELSMGSGINVLGFQFGTWAARG